MGGEDRSARVWARAVAGTALGAASAVVEAAALVPLLVLLPLAAARPGRRWLHRLLRPLERVERWRLASLFGIEIVGEPGPLRVSAYLAVRCPVGLFGGLVLGFFLPSGVYLAFSPLAVLDGNPVAVVPFGLALVYLSVQGIVGLVGTERWLARRLLGPSRQDLLRERVAELTASRAGVVTAVDRERRRIERDLHDGLQQRLVLVGMALGRARRDPGSARGRELVEQAHREMGNAIRDLKEVAWRVYPAVLAESGLAAALDGLAARSELPIRVSCRVPAEIPPAVETAAYFVVAEAVTNTVKHAGATRVDVHVESEGNALVVRVSDDGAGGADPSGTGLSGLAGRVGALDGSLAVDSPVGGPTTVTAVLPCG
ncbi:histidine kinase [Nocardiopsis sp. NPDC006139]|uniref:sensor histidine kinase n=1 Tax=Nocardiopsis sp. NPDC006139 TaxID=3154578 RepID=UPI0033A20711